MAKIQPVNMQAFDFYEIHDALINEFPETPYLKNDFGSYFYNLFNAPKNGAICYRLAESAEAWQNCAGGMPMHFYMDFALHYFCGIPWGGSAYIKTNY